MPGHAQDDSGLFREWTPRIAGAVQDGLGLAVFFSESYGRSEGTLAEFSGQFGIHCYFNRIVESDPARRGMIPNLDSGDTVLADAVGIPSITELELITGWRPRNTTAQLRNHITGLENIAARKRHLS